MRKIRSEGKTEVRVISGVVNMILKAVQFGRRKLYKKVSRRERTEEKRKQ